MKKTAFFVVLVVFIAMGGVLIQSIRSTTQGLSQILERLFVEDVSERFHAYAMRISGKQNLHVARLDRTESYERTSKAKALGIPLPDIVVSLTFPVEYNYHVSLQAPWKFEKRDQMIWVYAPELSGQTPAVNISKMKFETKKGSFFRDEQVVRERLQSELSGKLSENSIALRESVRAEARQAIESFVRTWVRSQFADAPENIPIKVLFPGESDVPKTPQSP